jgi:PHD/YefM family antitoxin component YafN of YafNO toxin-antitoxin module
MTRANLDNSLRAAVEAGTPVEVFDQATHRIYYLISAEQFQRMAAVLTDELNPRELYPMIDKVMAEDDAHDPLLESYQRIGAIS